MNSVPAEYRGVWVYLQHEEGGLSRDSLELLAAGRKIADKLSQKLVGVLLGYKLDEMPRDAIEFGADEVLLVDSPNFKSYLNLRYIDAIHQMVLERKPYAFLFVATELGKDIAARIAYRTKTGLATDNIQLEVEDYFQPARKETFKNLLIQIRPDFGTRVAKIYTPRTRPQIATVRPGNFLPLRRDTAREGRVIEFDYHDNRSYSASVKDARELPRPRLDLADAQVIISLRLGVLRDASGKPGDPLAVYKQALHLKDVIEKRYGLKTEIGASRALIYARVRGLEEVITDDNQVGQTGTTVSPKIYFAIGISGAVQHKVGMMKSARIVALNSDPNAPIFQIAHYALVGDLYELLPELIKGIEEGGVAA